MPLDLRLYLVLDPGLVRERSVEALLEEAVDGGVTLVQVREKRCSNEEFVSLARRAAKVLQALSVPLIVNDRVDVAQAVGAQGVHLGQSDLPWDEARRRLGPRAYLGVSVETPEQARRLARAPVEYLGVSSVFRTSTKSDVKTVWGLRGLEALRAETGHRLVGIGGVDAQNASDVIRSGADGIAVVSALCSVASPRAEARRLRRLVDSALRERKEGAAA